MNSMHKLSCVASLLLVAIIQPAISIGQNSNLDKKVGENRQKADTTRAEVARQIDEREAKRKEKLEARREEVRQWTKTQFEIGEREVIDKPAMMAPRLQKWRDPCRDNEVFRLLNFREKSVGGIESGKALNTLLGRIGSAALENSEARKLNPLYGVPLYGATAEMQVNNEMLRKLSWEQNLLGAKSSGAFNRDPGDVEWPQQILRDEQRWAESRHAIEEARALRVLDELKAGRGVTTDLEKTLCNAIATLNSDYAAVQQAVDQKSPAGGQPSRGISPPVQRQAAHREVDQHDLPTGGRDRDRGRRAGREIPRGQHRGLSGLHAAQQSSVQPGDKRPEPHGLLSGL